MATIRFSNNLNNKLFCRCFSSIRLLSEKYIINTEYSIVFGKSDNDIIEIGKATLIYIHLLKNIEEINNAMSFIDMGYNRKTVIGILKKMYVHRNINWANQQILFMIFRRNKLPQFTNELKNIKFND